MEIKNAKIKNVTVDFGNTHDLAAQVELETQDFSETIFFDFRSSYELELFQKMGEYTEAKKINEMKGKIIRLVYFSDIREAFGDAIDDRFVYFEKSKNIGDIIKEFSECDLKAKYNKLSRGEL